MTCVPIIIGKISSVGMYRMPSSGSGWPDRISGHFLISGSGQNGTKNRISEPDSDWSFLAVSSPVESVTMIVITVLPDNAEKLIFM